MSNRRAFFAYYLILPSLVLIVLLNLYPLIEGIIVSMQNQNMMRANQTAFVGFKHYDRALFQSIDFWGSLGRTVVWTAGSVAGAYLVGLSLALLLNMQIRGRGFFRALFLIPWVVPEVVTALLWKWCYSDEFGIINFLLARVGLLEKPIPWLSNPDIAMPAVIVVQVWKLYPVMTIVLLAALQNVPNELHEAASIDGAGVWQRLRYVTLPLIRSASVIITMLGAIWTFQNFDIVYLLTGGGPADATQILPTLVYEKAFWALEIGYASALGVLILICLMVMSVLYLLVYRSQAQAEPA